MLFIQSINQSIIINVHTCTSDIRVVRYPMRHKDKIEQNYLNKMLTVNQVVFKPSPKRSGDAKSPEFVKQFIVRNSIKSFRERIVDYQELYSEVRIP